jgi:hypothetical protein
LRSPLHALPRSLVAAMARRLRHLLMKPTDRSSAHPQFLALGTIASATPRTQILAALQRLCPQLEIRLRALANQQYRLQVRAADLSGRQTSNTAWLRIKGALASEFPAHKPGSVEIVEP